MGRSRSRCLLGLLVVAVLLLGSVPAGAHERGAGSTGEFHDSTVLVRLLPGVDLAGVLRLAGVGEAASHLDALDVHVLRVPAGTVLRAVRVLDALPGVLYAEPNYRFTTSTVPNDAYLAEQTALELINAPAGWALYDPAGEFRSTGGATIAVIDSGIDVLNPEFAGKIGACQSWLTGLGVALPTCQDVVGHGTHVAGIAAAAANNGHGIAGVAYDARIMALQALAVQGFAADIAAAITYAADRGADVANYSFGGTQDSAVIRQAVAYAAGRGVLQVAAAGNGGQAGVNYPAAYREVVAVAATDDTDVVAPFSARGPQVEVSAPGVEVLSTLPVAGLTYGRLSGTSMAAPHVAGLAALLRNRDLDAPQARQAIIDGVDLVDGATGRTDEYGHGRINVATSLAAALGRQPAGRVTPPPSSSPGGLGLLRTSSAGLFGLLR